MPLRTPKSIVERRPERAKCTYRSEAAEERLEGAEPRSAAGGAQEGAERPWWRRVLGG
jgi:hypothetical protein